MFDEGATTLAPPQPGQPKPTATNRTPTNPQEPWSMPAAFLGQTVLWRPDPRENMGICPAKVTKVGTDSLGLAVFQDGNAVLLPRDGVRHVRDPRWTRDSGDNGVWWYPENEAEALAAFGDLTKALESHYKNLSKLSAVATYQAEQIQFLTARIEALEQHLGQKPPEAIIEKPKV
jgi:hypothetical protein